MNQVSDAYKKLKRRIASLEKTGDVDKATVDAWHDKFATEVGNDVNTAQGLTLLYDVIKSEANGATKRAVIADFDTVLSLNLLTEDTTETGAPEVDDELAATVEAKIAERAEAKKAKDFARADAIREELLAMGIAIKDTREGVVWERV